MAKILLYQIVVLTTALFCSIKTAFADIHVSYLYNDQKIELFSKNTGCRIINSENTVKIIDFTEKLLRVYSNNDTSKYVETPLTENSLLTEEENRDRKLRDRPFAAKFLPLGKTTDFQGKKAMTFEYNSKIEQKEKLLAVKLGDVQAFEVINCLRNIHSRGNELLKKSSFYYALMNSYLPVSIKTSREDWEATQISFATIEEDILKAPKESKKISTKEFFLDLVKSLDKEPNKDK